VQLRSGGYLVINQTEALVAIDVNSGRSTRERGIEETALKTNLEAADEVARQLRLRDLAGLIVIDFIDMEVRRNNASVERRLKDSLANDRARIQVGNISHFGLMEMSRQRLRPSVSEASLVLCPHCAGTGHVRSPESAALHILRAIEDEGAKFHAAEVVVHLPQDVALYLFNHKRDRLAAIEARYRMKVVFAADAAMLASNFRIEKVKAQTAVSTVAPPASYAGSLGGERGAERGPERGAERGAERVERTTEPLAEAAAEDEDDADGVEAAPPGESAEDGERRRRRRRRRGKRRPDGEAAREPAQDAASAGETGAEPPSEFDLALQSELGGAEQSESGGEEQAGRRRRNRGGRRRRPGQEDGPSTEQPAFAPAPVEPVYGDIADIFEAAERAEAAQAERRAMSVDAPGVNHGSEPAAAAEHDPALKTADAEPEAEPAPAQTGGPTVIGQPPEEGAPEPEKKRGWWRR
jgi:ribonuclease E